MITKDAAKALMPILVEQPLDVPLAVPSSGNEASEVHNISWRTIKDGWTYIKAVPDTGAQVSVADEDLAPGYALKETPASRAGRGFVSASKHTIPSKGEYDVPTQSPEGHWTRQRWQIAPSGSLAKPLFSIGEECDKDCYVVFSKRGGAIINEHTGAIRKFPRLANGTYEITMRLPPASIITSASQGFPRPGR